MTIDELVQQQGIENIQKTTRITKENLQKIISKDFGNLNKAQVFGFLSILEREYGVIDNLRELCEEYYSDKEKIKNATSQIEPNRTYFVNTRSNPLNFKLIWLIGGLLALFFIAFMAFDKDNKPDMQIPKMTVDLNDTNKTVDLNGTQNKETNATDINATNSDIDKNITATAKKKSINKSVKNNTIDKSYSIDNNKSETIVKTKPKYNDQKNDYLKVEDSNKSQESNL